MIIVIIIDILLFTTETLEFLSCSLLYFMLSLSYFCCLRATKHLIMYYNIIIIIIKQIFVYF